MYFFTLLYALWQMAGSTLTGNAWTYAFLEKLVGVNQFLFNVSWIVPVVVLVVGLGIAALSLFGKSAELFSSSLSCMGCAMVFLVLFPLGQWIALFLS